VRNSSENKEKEKEDRGGERKTCKKRTTSKICDEGGLENTSIRTDGEKRKKNSPSA